jgi:hypothetical protein
MVVSLNVLSKGGGDHHAMCLCFQNTLYFGGLNNSASNFSWSSSGFIVETMVYHYPYYISYLSCQVNTLER